MYAWRKQCKNFLHFLLVKTLGKKFRMYPIRHRKRVQFVAIDGLENI